MLYARPPLKEAVCQIIFGGGAIWDGATAGLIYEKVQSTFNDRNPDVKSSLPLRVSSEDDDGVEQVASATVRFATKDGNSVLQLGPGLLAVNTVSGYTNWSDFKALVLESVISYSEVVKPDHLHIVALGFSNAISVPNTDRIPDYIKLYPAYGDPPIDFIAFNTEVSEAFDNGRDVMVINAYSGASSSTETTVELSKMKDALIGLTLTYILSETDAVAIDALAAWLDQGHQRLETAFDTIVTEKAKATFIPVETLS